MNAQKSNEVPPTQASGGERRPMQAPSHAAGCARSCRLAWEWDTGGRNRRGWLGAGGVGVDRGGFAAGFFGGFFVIVILRGTARRERRSSVGPSRPMLTAPHYNDNIIKP
jgi:hypothetical protein